MYVPGRDPHSKAVDDSVGFHVVGIDSENVGFAQGFVLCDVCYGGDDCFGEEEWMMEVATRDGDDCDEDEDKKC